MIAPPAVEGWWAKLRRWWDRPSPTLPCPKCAGLHDLSICPKLYDRTPPPPYFRAAVDRAAARFGEDVRDALERHHR